MNPAARDQDAVDAAAAELAKGFQYLEHYMGPGPFCVGAEPTLGDCSAAPYVMLIKKIVFANFDSVSDPTASDGRLGAWWQAIQGNEACRTTVEEYGDAVDGFMKAMAARASGG
jgi:glutathione S-transferase